MNKPQNDSDIHAWSFYQKYYGEKLSCNDNKKNYTVNKTKISVNGDVCFNTKLKYNTYYTLLGSIIKEEPRFDDLNKLLSDLLYSPMNLSILPKTGGLNIIKKNFADDRLDSFVWLLNQYYVGVTAPILNRGTKNSYIGNQLCVKEFLNELGNEKEFCSSFYGIPEEFVSRLIDSGKSAICKPSEFYYFLMLATEFWNIRLKDLIKRNILNNDEYDSYNSNLRNLNYLLHELLHLKN